MQPEALLLNDLCREMEECVKELCDGTTVQFVPGDAEAIDFPGETDLITSCSTLQWFNDPGAFFTRCHQAPVSYTHLEAMQQNDELHRPGNPYLCLYP